MVAETPFLPNADKLGPLASRYLNVADLPWQETRFPGVDMKVLVEDKDSGLITALFRFAPGTQLPYHEHVAGAELEQPGGLEGRWEEGEATPPPGIFVGPRPGNRHNAHSPNGCLVLSIFLKPNKFLDKDTVGWDTARGT